MAFPVCIRCKFVSTTWFAVAVVLCAVIAPRSLPGMPANPNPVKLTQPDGTVIMLRVRGDEREHWFEDLDGYTVVMDKGWYAYARRGERGTLVPSSARVGLAAPQAAGLMPHATPSPEARAASRAQALASPPQPAAGPLRVSPLGTVKNLVVLCKFSDHTYGTHTRDAADYATLFNAVGGNPTLAPTGSVRDCYYENSYGQMTLVSTVAAWVTLPQTEAYYANGSNGTEGAFPNNAQGMVRDALNLVDALIDFGQFDSDNNGYIDAIDIIHSGYAAETGGGGGNWIWSHRWTLYQVPGGKWTSADINANGVKVKVFDYHTEAALWGTSGNSILRIGVIAHETGHFFGLPDLYDTDGGGQGIGSYCMMANSWGFSGTQWNPPHFSAWCKIALGWVSPIVIDTPGNYSAAQVETSPVVYRINNGYPIGEYLLVENREPVGLEQTMPQGGLAVWHIDEAKGGNTEEGYPGQSGWPGNNKHYQVALLQADGNYDLEHGRNRGDSGDVYRSGGVAAISEATVPNSNSYRNGVDTITYNSLTSISAAGASMTFTYGNIPPPPSITVTAPEGGEVWPRGAVREIRWTSINAGPAVDVFLLKGGAIFAQLAENTANDGLFSWTISAALPVGQDYRIRITNGTVADDSNADFSLVHVSTLLSQDFESGLGSFTIDNTYGAGQGLWHLSTGRASDAGHTPTTSIYYGHNEGPAGGGNYDVGTSAGVVMTTLLDLVHVQAPITLDFNYFLETESLAPPFDVAVVEVSSNGQAYTPVATNEGTGVALADPCTSWKHAQVDLSSYAGASIRIRLRFETIDESFNTYEGWYLDDIVVTGLSALGDFDGDGDVDITDFGHLQACISGSGAAATDPLCANARLDVDNDIDTNDVNLFTQCLTGANIPASLDCIP